MSDKTTTKPRSSPKKKKPLRIEDVVEAARAAGATVSFHLDKPERMPRRFPNDPEHILRLLDESERLNELGNRWVNATNPNPIAADLAFRAGWAHALAAAFLRTPPPPPPPPKA